MSRPEVIGETSDSNIHAANANMLQSQGKIPEAIDEYLKAIRESGLAGIPSNPRHHINLANCYSHQAQVQPELRDNLFAAAEAHLLQALLLAKGNPLSQMEALLNRAAHIATELDSQEILEELREAITVLPALVKQMHERGAETRRQPMLMTLAEFAIRDRFGSIKSKPTPVEWEIPTPAVIPEGAQMPALAINPDEWVMPAPSLAITISDEHRLPDTADSFGDLFDEWLPPKHDGWELTEEDTTETIPLPAPAPIAPVAPIRRPAAADLSLSSQNLVLET